MAKLVICISMCLLVGKCTMKKMFMKIIIIVFVILAISIIIYYSDNNYEVINYNVYSKLQDIEYSYGINYNIEDELLYSIKNKLIKKINREYKNENCIKDWYNIKNSMVEIQYGNNQSLIINFSLLEIENINESYHIYGIKYIAEKEYLYFVLSNWYNNYICSYNISKSEIKIINRFYNNNYQYSEKYTYKCVDNKIFVPVADNKIYIYDVIDMKSRTLDIKATIFSVNKNGNLIAYIDNDNNLCIYNFETKTSRIIRKIKRNIGIIDIDDDGNFVILVEDSNIYSLLAGVDSHRGYKINFLNLYEVSTGKCQTIKKSGLFKVIRDAYFVDESINK